MTAGQRDFQFPEGKVRTIPRTRLSNAWYRAARAVFTGHVRASPTPGTGGPSNVAAALARRTRGRTPR